MATDHSKSKPTGEKQSLKWAWSGYMNHLNFGGHQSYRWNGYYGWSKSDWFCTQIGYIKSQHTDDKSPLKGVWLGSRDPL